MSEGIDIARARIAEEAVAKTGFLDLGQIGLIHLPDELFALSHLQALNLGRSYPSDDGRYHQAASDIAPNSLSDDLSRLRRLPRLSALYLNTAEINNLAPLQGLESLQSLDCSATQVGDLTPLQGLGSLQRLDCSGTPVSDLTPLQGLQSLQSLGCSGTPVGDLTPLQGLGSLQRLDCSGTPVSDLTPLQGLESLQSLDCSATPVGDLTPLQGLGSLQRLTCFRTPVSDLTPLQGLESLQRLTCFRTEVSDLTPLQGLESLQSLTCSGTQVGDLTPLQGLKRLQSLNCFGTQVRDLTPLQGLESLQGLDCSRTEVSDLTPLQGLGSLQRLDCSGTPVSDVTPLQGLESLQSLDCSRTEVSDLTPLQGLASLQSLDCSATLVSDVTPLQGLKSLQSLNCFETQVSDLTPLQGLKSLARLRISGCTIDVWPDQLWRMKSLLTVYADSAELAGIPTDVLPTGLGQNCLPAIRAHLDDLGEAPERLTDVKLIVLGNGRIGKTQIVNRLRGEPFEEDAESTHGVSLVRAPIPGLPDEEFNIWDFGGQDIYFGTHMLFLKCRAVFMLVWTPQSDDAESHQHGGMTFRNQPVAWWLDCIRCFGNADAPLVVVQNQLDLDRDRGDHAAVAEIREELKHCHSVAYSAATNDGRKVLEGYLIQTAKRFNPPLIGKGRLAVMREVQRRREADRARLPEDKRHRTLSFDAFNTLCEKTGGISDPVQFLNFLHNAGQVFWRENLFQSRVILDQAWVLDAVYTVFHRERCLAFIRRHQGRFTRSDLGMLIWDGEGYSTDEQDLFISFMRSCGICFTLREGSHEAEAVHVAPDHLPEDWEAEARQERWGQAPPDAEATFTYNSLPPALMRNLIGRIGNKAGLSCDYWRHGFYGYENRSDARVLVEQERDDRWQGAIRIQARGGRAGELVAEMEKALIDEERRLGLSSERQDAERLLEEAGREESEAERAPPKLDFVPEPLERRAYFVSYAWEDDLSEAGEMRALIVDQFCARAEERGIVVNRDKDVMKLGDRISTFMKRIARGDRVVVVLSDKYLRSPFCMYELYEIWLQARGEDARFLQRIRVYTQADAKIWTPLDRAGYAIHWSEEYQRHQEVLKKHGLHVFGDKDKLAISLMQKFSSHIGDILTITTDILQPRDLDELVRYGLDGGDFDD